MPYAELHAHSSYSFLDGASSPAELAEEADLDAERIEPLLSVFTTPGGNDEVVHIFLARGLRPASATFAREAEEADIRVEWVPLADAVEAVVTLGSSAEGGQP